MLGIPAVGAVKMNAHASFTSPDAILLYDETAPPPAPFQLVAQTRMERIVPDSAFKEGLTVLIPALRAFAMSMVRHPDQADDLVQDALLKAWANRHRYEDGTNLRAWLFVILRNTLFSQYRRSKREVEDRNGIMAEALSTPPSQDGHMDLEDFKVALARLPSEQREALILIGGSGFSCEEAAAICGCAVGTVKSRVNRARTALAEILGVRPHRRPIVVKIARSRPSTSTSAPASIWQE